MKYTIGLDVGGSKIFGGLFDAKYKLVHSKTIATPVGVSNKLLISLITEIIQSLWPENIEKIGIGVAGFVQNGILVKSPNMPKIKQLNFSKELKKKFHVTISVENDSRLFTLAESIIGSAKSARVVACVTFGTGVGGGLVVDKQIFHGGSGLAGEIGHTYFEGASFEQMFGGRNMVNHINATFKTKFKNPTEVEKEIFSKTKLGKEMRKIHVYFIAKFFFNLILMYDPNMIVIGGSIGKRLISKLIPEIKKELHKCSKELGLPLHAQIKVSKLENSTSLGAVLIK